MSYQIKINFHQSFSLRTEHNNRMFLQYRRMTRAYSDYKEMAENENNRDDGVEAVGIMTPSGDHCSGKRETSFENS